MLLLLGGVEGVIGAPAEEGKKVTPAMLEGWGEKMPTDDEVLLGGVEGVIWAPAEEGKKVTPAMLEGWKEATPTDEDLPRCVRLCLTRFAFVVNFFPQFWDVQLKKLVAPCRAT